MESVVSCVTIANFLKDSVYLAMEEERAEDTQKVEVDENEQDLKRRRMSLNWVLSVDIVMNLRKFTVISLSIPRDGNKVMSIH